MSETDLDFEAKASKAFFNRELSWLSFARRVLAQARDRELPLLERVKFVGILGMLHDEFFMNRGRAGPASRTGRGPPRRSSAHPGSRP